MVALACGQGGRIEASIGWIEARHIVTTIYIMVKINTYNYLAMPDVSLDKEYLIYYSTAFVDSCLRTYIPRYCELMLVISESES